ncbi:aminodeoxychorismate synthase component I [Pollutimonas harenae]|uniref:Aminodeoxychorismate synthase component I n=1 Tax=Pollutimonas harenae TaxID=657015 RepID=A0A853GSZ0_9BURK|nr:aminodeoxychorismate synthase component I [Pollutimonas harenae]NYT85321.1 aminodeoxychorismate synthase component I [Pollutimonas harenae]TEA71487.1 aminodeoxychorismate synthase component I [Pollutimonas harenae]
MLCRFENRLSGQALELDGFSRRITASSASELGAVFGAIEAAQAAGCWIALLLDYELGEWLEPASQPMANKSAIQPQPRLTALVFKQARHATVWAAPAQAVSLENRPLIDPQRYLDDIHVLRESIGRGELYQANYTFPIAVETQSTPRDLYRSIAARHPAAHAAYIEDGSRSILSFSPELFVAREGTTLTVRPMKGTAPRHDDPAQDEAAGQALLRSEKNRAENLMIVDLLRNDLGRIATPGSVKVEKLFSLEQYPSVWTLTSTIKAEAPGISLEQLLRALFPCGSITGAPKIASMQKIKQLENRPRGIYCGSVGWLAPNGDCSLNVAIRTIAMHDARHGIFGVGGGIVYDSEPEQEWQECLWKARILNIQNSG